MKIKCEEEDCGQVYPFNETLSHRKICSVKKIACIQNCGNGKLYKGVDEMMVHVMEECTKTSVICERCKTKGPREDFEKHNCVVGLINQVKTEDAVSYKNALSAMQSQFASEISKI